MSAKKRGPGRPPKSKNKKPSASSVAVHTVPKYFWSQIGAIVLAVVTAILAAGLFGMGGTLPVKFAELVRWFVGWTAFIVPIVFAIQIVQVFKQPDARIPAVIWVSTIVFLALFAGTFQLTLEDPRSLATAQAGNGGGVIGWAVADMTLGFVNVPLAALIFVALMLILLMFIFSVSPGAVVEAVKDFVGHEDVDASSEQAVALVANANNGRVKIGGLSKGEIVKDSKGDDEGEENKSGPKKEKHHGLLSKRSDDEEAVKPDKKLPGGVTIKTSNKIEKDTHKEPVVINNSGWKFPDVSELSDVHKDADPGNMKLRTQQIESTLAEFGIRGNVRQVVVGPRVAQYCLEPQKGVPLKKIASLQDKFLQNLQVESLRIETPIPGQPYVGVEVPNKSPASVNLRSILESKEWTRQIAKPLAFAVGLNIAGDPVVLNLADLPHLLIAGQTGSGKSVMMNVIVMSLLFHNTPDDMKLALIDPKGNEMSMYADMPHLVAPVISGVLGEEQRLVKTLLWLTTEMDRRYKLFSERGVRKISDFRKKYPDEKMPYLVLIVDEYADMLDTLKSTERETAQTAIQRIAQKGRAAGIHEVIMMQAPRAKYIQGPLKANIPAGFAFSVLNNQESRQIIGQAGAEKLMGHGDMLMVTNTIKKPRRIQAAFVSDDEIEQIIAEMKVQSGPQYDEDLLAHLSDDTPANGGVSVSGSKNDSRYRKAVELVLQNKRATASFIQRRLHVGSNAAADLIDRMEEDGIVGPQNGTKSREILVSSIDEVFSDQDDDSE